ncbi:TPA: 23S rRNA methyltransferase attenuation leader peptide [Enterococcus faecium]|nr:23S rRNA methyltransferase attenuation leader peptide [Enterococcus faecium]HAZ1129512.1 23S rRNA methyltransferase attenuation leader peptide [Enterococcus faecium]
MRALQCYGITRNRTKQTKNSDYADK